MYTATEIQNMTGFSPLGKVKLCESHAKKWEARSSAHARVGEFREADDAETEAIALWALADEILPSA